MNWERSYRCLNNPGRKHNYPCRCVTVITDQDDEWDEEAFQKMQIWDEYSNPPKEESCQSSKSKLPSTT